MAPPAGDANENESRETSAAKDDKRRRRRRPGAQEQDDQAKTNLFPPRLE